MDKSVLKQFLKAGFVYKNKLFSTIAGTPQGGIISPILANMTLDGIEESLQDRYSIYKNKHGIIKRNEQKVNFVRYADDFIITAKNEEVAKDAKTLIQNFLKEKGLELSEEKTLITHINDGFDFLGWNFKKYKGKLLIKPSKSSIQKITNKLSETIKKGRTWTQDNLIRTINPIITGWTNYHQGTVAKKTFSKLDHIIWNMLYGWAKRRHHMKSKHWITSKYWHKKKARNWVFHTETSQLKRFSDKRIIRNTRLSLDKNPYLDKDYFIKRQFDQGNSRLTGKFKTIWENQKGICPMCKNPINTDSDATERPLHHKSGIHTDNRPSNLIYVHAHCHRQHHANSPKPRESASLKGVSDA